MVRSRKRLRAVARVIAALVAFAITATGFAAAPKIGDTPVSGTVFSQADPATFSTIVNGAHWPVIERFSPDGRYVARIVGEDAEVGYLYVAGANQARGSALTNRALLVIYDVHGCVWLPTSRHALAYSSGGCDYGRGYLGIWNGQNHLLKRALSENGEGFDIFFL